ncbi:hypothetical protein [Sphingomonas sp.]|uniref:hypothetical protein n=1 Tax=Sphingomonas sp. TaxID=28214 RepID=UPI001B07AFC3|nr:hypothetical protein [Sphingomonas sp.]MBO9712331.1 hypothetical protein [Sphingomonas sp.]
MTRALAIQATIGAVVAISGVAILTRPGVLRAGEHDPRGHALRIIGMMLFAAGFMGTGFAVAYALAA